MDKYFGNIKSVCCQGGEGTYSHTASLKIFPGIKPMLTKSFKEIILNIKNGICDAGILPVENSTAGLVSGIVEMLVKFGLNIVYAKSLDISHNLCAKKGAKLEDIKKIYSHQQALLQCSEFLKALNTEYIESASTAMSAKFAASNEDCAAVCSKEAAQIFRLEILKENICNNARNQTRFLVVSRDNYISPSANITSLYFKIKNASGSLYKALGILAKHGVNLVSLHSIPLEEEIWNYGFYADAEGSVNDDKLKNCLKELESSLQFLKILGSYISE